MGLCAIGMGRKLAPTLCSLARDPALFAFSIMAFSMLLGKQRGLAVRHGANALVTNVHL